eukprot:TRINITY_DN3540_c0_g2_i1.p1 TRINITY_DN3540_c0_g2~~TRINITY_DN3540_c0_g2_i1.p1  ORF type:complete len:699 (-),score=90.17 TRINITY_DN3540_c0_g2_i1:73-2169(-)
MVLCVSHQLSLKAPTNKQLYVRKLFKTRPKVRICRRLCSEQLKCNANVNDNVFDPNVGSSNKEPNMKQILGSISGVFPLALMMWTVPALLPVFGGNGNGGIGGGGGDGGNNGGSNWMEQFVVARADEDDDDEEYEEVEEEIPFDEDEIIEEELEEEVGPGGESISAQIDQNNFYLESISCEGLPEGPGLPTQEDLLAGLKCQPGFYCSRSDMSADLRTLLQQGIFSNVRSNIVPVPDKKNTAKIVFIFTGQKFAPVVSFKIEGTTLLPPEMSADVMSQLAKGEPTTIKTLAQIRSIVEGWYQKHGYALSFVRDFDGLDSGNIVARVVEGKTNQVKIVRVDEDGTPVKGPKQYPDHIIQRELPFQRGLPYNVEDGRRALRDIFSLGLFDNVQVQPKQNPRDESRVDVDVMVKERSALTYDVDVEWGIAPSGGPVPLMLASIIPGGSLTVEHNNVHGKGHTFAASINCGNMWRPQDDGSLRIAYKQPYILGDGDPQRTSGNVEVFNSRRLGGVFQSNDPNVETPEIWVDRLGTKLYFAQKLSRHSKAAGGVVLQQVSTRDNTGGLTGTASPPNFQGSANEAGPPTALSPTGQDRSLFLQGSVTRDTTYLSNNALLGQRDILQVNQGTLIGGLFNRMQIGCTRYVKVVPEGSGSRPPVVCALHGGFGSVIGDLPPYDAFMLGGPNSVRGYSVGELASCRSS